MANIEWETRAKERRLENKQLKKRIKELTLSRDFWKVKALERKGRLEELNQKLLVVKKKHEADNKFIAKSKPRGSHFSLDVILTMLAAKINTSVSFRSLSKVFITFNLYLNIELSSPSYCTTMLWIKKIGLTQLQSPKEKADDWIIILDESIGIGQEKVLVVLGIRRSHVDFTRPLILQDMEPITVKSKESWTGQDIAHELEMVKQKLGGVIYAVTDGGNALKYGLKEVGVKHVYDITHSLAVFLQRLYEKDENFRDYTHNAAQMRFKLGCSKHAHLIPPNQRSKSRFLNIDTISKWGMNVLHVLENNDISVDERSQLQWVKEKEQLIIEMDFIISIVQEISIILKREGLSKQTKTRCISLLKNCKRGKSKQFKEYMLNYLSEYTKQISHRKEKILCCSDIIESTFGRYKYELSKNPMSGITDLVLIIPALTLRLSDSAVSDAIANCRVKDIEAWKENNLCNSLLAKRSMVFQN